ncbi:type VII secretion-associated protein [Amycolatopsis jejuensis]|uniref:type VII secretion-associated protein n=1 Tax=Amycolatopsis jejuensis TaxID=330084 RepID=UPI000523FD22|nr:type VII secretion-associated protein [Amycolatopsis jejuensis]
MTVRVAVDFGTSSTCVVASVNGREPQVVVVDGQPLMSSAVYAAADGTLFVGQEAERQAAVDPSRYEPNPKRRIDEGELLLGEAVLRVTDVVHAVLERAVTEARHIAGDAEVDLLVLTHPADWGAIRTRLLRQAAGRLAREVALVPEPVAAAVYHAATFAPVATPDGRTVEFSGSPGDALAVLDLGGGTVDVSVVRRSPEAARAARVPGSPPQRGGFQVLATRGDPSFGGADIDQALLDHVGSLVSGTDPEAWQQLVEGRELADRRRRRVLRQDVRGAKETLSRHVYTDVPLPPPFADAHVTREDLERLIGTPLGRVVELTVAAITDAGLRPRQLTAIFLVGGSSRIPMISRLVHERTSVVPTSLDQPETVVARGALRAVQLDPDRTGALPGTRGDHRTEIVQGDGPGGDPRFRRGAPSPSSAPLPAQPHGGLLNSGLPNAGRSNIGPSNAGPSNAGPSNIATPNAGPRNAAMPNAGPPHAASPTAGPPTAGPLNAGSAGTASPNAGPPNAGTLNPASPNAGQLNAAPPSGPLSGGGQAPNALSPNASPSSGPLPHFPPGAARPPSGQPPHSPRPHTPPPNGPRANIPQTPSPGRFSPAPSGGDAQNASSGKGGSSNKRRWWITGAAVALVAVIAAGVVFFLNRDREPEGRTFAQYDFSLVAPVDWVQTTDQVADRQVILHPPDALAGNDLVLAQEFVMDYDATADRQRIVTDLQSRTSKSADYTAFQANLTYGGRSVIGYHERKPDGINVRWYVLVQGRIRVHVGCQFQVPALQQRVDAACEQVVRTLKITS